MQKTPGLAILFCRMLLVFLCLQGSTNGAGAQDARSYPDPPQVLFQDLFTAVQINRIFPDGKEFVDAVPKSSPSDILKLYHQQRPRSRAELTRFVEQHFDLPKATLNVVIPKALPEGPCVPQPLEDRRQNTRSFAAEAARDDDVVSNHPNSDHAGIAAKQCPIDQHIAALWEQLTRDASHPPPYSSLVAMPLPFVVPGSRFRELYYWDSYFTMLGLAESERQDLMRDLAGNFAYLIDTYGHVPNGNRSYYLSRSQPPFFFKIVALLSPNDEAAAFAQYLPQLRKEYAFWMEGAEGLHPNSAHRRAVSFPDGSILNRYWDDRDSPRDESYREDVTLAGSSHRSRSHSELFRNIRAAAESGWDFSSRWFADGKSPSTIDTVEIIPPDLNSLLFGLENAIRSGCERAGDQTCALEFSRRAAARRAALDKYLWDEAAGYYMDYNITLHKRTARLSAATLYPLFAGMASDRQASRVAAVVSRQLIQPGGLATTTTKTRQQWDSPNGWAPLQWIAVDGLTRYGHTAAAEEIACRWMTNVKLAYRRSGKLVEKYNVIAPNQAGGGGEYPLQDGFGWTNGVMSKLMAIYPNDLAYGNVDSCPRAIATAR